MIYTLLFFLIFGPGRTLYSCVAVYPVWSYMLYAVLLYVLGYKNSQQNLFIMCSISRDC